MKKLSRFFSLKVRSLSVLAVFLLLTPGVSFAEEVGDLRVAIDTVWVMIGGVLVFFMNAGFGLVESGLAQSKNCVNILSKNFIVFAVSTFAFYIVGWGLMFGDGTPYFGTQGLWFFSGADNSPATGDAYQGVYSSIKWAGVPLGAKFFFQLVFAGTAATIVSGAVAERIKYLSFILFSFLLVTLIYPVVGHWIWGGGFLSAMGFHDFAGSTVVHSVGGWCALTGVIVLGPRRGKFRDGKIYPIPGHNMTSAFIGCLILWLGWFGFNPGSTMAANGVSIAHIALNTNFSGAAGALTATIAAWILLKKPDFSMTLNGCLAGLVAITAPCAVVTYCSAIVIGGIAGVLVVFAVLFFDKVKIDDPVGATSVHLVNGVFGTLCVALFGNAEVAQNIAAISLPSFGTQLLGVAAVAGYSLVASFVFWFAIKLTVGLRVTPEEESEGLDVGEHGNVAYPDFQAANR